MALILRQPRRFDSVRVFPFHYESTVYISYIDSTELYIFCKVAQIHCTAFVVNYLYARGSRKFYGWSLTCPVRMHMNTCRDQHSCKK